MTQEELGNYILNEQRGLSEAMTKSKREDIWFSDIETAIVRAVNAEKEALIKRACEWLGNHSMVDTELFKQAME